MPIDYRVEHEVAIIGNLAGAMHDERLLEAARDLERLLDRGHRRFVFELSGVGPLGPSALGLLMTLSRVIRKRGGEVVLARVGRSTLHSIREMKLDADWDTFRTVAEAIAFLVPSGAPPDEQTR